MELLLAMFIVYTGSSMAAAAVVTLFCIIDVMITDRQYPPNTGLAIIFMSCLLGAVITVGIFSGAYILTLNAAEALGILLGVLAR